MYLLQRQQVQVSRANLARWARYRIGCGPAGNSVFLRKGVIPMENNIVLKEGQNKAQAVTSDEIFKVTALLYFKEALAAQKYEDCEELVGIARKLGARQGEIDEMIAAHLRGDKPGGRNEARQGINRLRF